LDQEKSGNPVFDTPPFHASQVQEPLATPQPRLSELRVLEASRKVAVRVAVAIQVARKVLRTSGGFSEKADVGRTNIREVNVMFPAIFVHFWRGGGNKLALFL
jgi:hypothetical protein